MLNKKRKPRSDRNHIIYQYTCVKTGERYIGLTVIQKAGKESTMNNRWKKHEHRAFIEQVDWTLHKRIRRYKEWTKEILEIVRGKDAAHAREWELIQKRKPELNSHI